MKVLNWNYPKLEKDLKDLLTVGMDADLINCATIYLDHIEDGIRIRWAQDLIHEQEYIKRKLSLYDVLIELRLNPSEYEIEGELIIE